MRTTAEKSGSETNGAGKTTTLRVLLGLLRADAGRAPSTTRRR
ncbi:hypothetical protein [Saccharothrix variisporea]|nr:hypothetical protein [Saccharothrix variisporea]